MPRSSASLLAVCLAAAILRLTWICLSDPHVLYNKPRCRRLPLQHWMLPMLLGTYGRLRQVGTAHQGEAGGGVAFDYPSMLPLAASSKRSLARCLSPVLSSSALASMCSTSGRMLSVYMLVRLWHVDAHTQSADALPAAHAHPVAG